jgi:hypothetical protein
VTTETLDQEQEPTEQEAEAQLAAGYARAKGEKQGATGDGSQAAAADADPQQTDEERKAAEAEAAKEAEAAAKAQAEADAKAAAEREWEGVPKVVRDRLAALERVPGQIDKLAGNLGGLQSKLDSALTTARATAQDKGGAAPSEGQVKAALADPKAWERLKEDFPEWAGPMEAELTALRAEIASVKSGDPKELRESVKAEIRAELAAEAVEDAHPGWQERVKTQEFVSWLKDQPEDVRALTASDRPRDAIRLLDAYKTHSERAAADAEARRKKQERLAAAVTPKGSQEPPQTGIDDEAAFARGYKRARGK